ncbi:hypothetical protein VB780_05370 [Leptolyngbya sp. CCNP1308]|uniref:hypothetical protein n=1 Tax=Leptolyngbya sp. CCNP1308 TaxID=3110255 RepID=UPI002B1E91CC|nr:hypothetical protein [Leptolyngbya sp. CCNP1308]MEA5447989.1 hypothetical protein [Leptolyngbya sp. CCNP1308]
MAELPTIAIATSDLPQGWMLINAADFDPEQHRVYDGLIHEPDSTGEEMAPPGPGPKLSDLNLTELRSLASDEKIPGRSGMDREELLEALQAKDYEL